MNKQILLLENLGIPEADVQKAAKALGYSLAHHPQEADPEAVEVIITIKKEINKKTIDLYPQLKMIAVAFTGYDGVDKDACLQNNIAVYNVPDYATNSVAELAVGLAISLLREIPKADQLVKNKKWDLEPGSDLRDKVVGIVGTGAIGIETAKSFRAFGCPILGWSRSEKEEFKAIGGTYVNEKKDLFAQSDIISLHLPLNKHTKGLIGKEELNAMKKSAWILNTARSPIIREEDLISVLKQGKIAGAALDVFDEEPIRPDNELLNLDNVVLTPHIAYKTEEALRRRAETTFKNIENFNKGKNENRVG